MSRPTCNPINEVLIRKATITDVDVIYKMLCELENTVLPFNNFLDVFHANLGNSNINYFVAFLNDSCIGMVSCHIQLLLHHAAPVGEIQEMFVNPDYRSKGIGKKFLVRVIEFIRSKGATQLEVTTNKIRLDTHRFYEREGFKKTHLKLVLHC